MSLLLTAQHVKQIASRWPDWRATPSGATPNLLMASMGSTIRAEHDAGSIKVPLAPIKPVLTGHTGATMVTYDTAGNLGQDSSCANQGGMVNNLASFLANLAQTMVGGG